VTSRRAIFHVAACSISDRQPALTVYRELLSRNPDDTSLRDRIDQIESGSISSIGMASVSEDVVESARKRHSGRPPRSVRSFFASLAGRRAPAPRHPVETESTVDAALSIDELSSTQASSSAQPFAVDDASSGPDMPATQANAKKAQVQKADRSNQHRQADDVNRLDGREPQGLLNQLRHARSPAGSYCFPNSF